MSAPFGEIREWIAVLAGGGVLGSIITLIVKAALEDKRDEKKRLHEDEKETRDKRIDTDRATYNQRITILIRTNLAAFIRSGKWYSDEDDLRRLVRSLAQGTYEHFLDALVDALWVTLVDKSIALARKRLGMPLDEAEILDYNEVRKAWEDAAKRSFGPLPPLTEIPIPRQTPHSIDDERAA